VGNGGDRTSLRGRLRGREISQGGRTCEGGESFNDAVRVQGGKFKVKDSGIIFPQRSKRLWKEKKK